MIMLFQRAGYVTEDRTADLLDELQQLSKMQNAFQKRLRSNPS